GICSETALPQPVAQHENGIAPQLLFLRQESSADLRFFTEELEEIRRDPLAGNQLRSVADSYAEPSGLHRCDIRERARIPAHVEKFRRRSEEHTSELQSRLHLV